MKKWLIALCCIVLAGAVAFVTVVNNKQGQIDTLNKDLSDVQAENNTLKEKGEQDAKTIQDLNQQVEALTAEKDVLTAENGQLTENLEGLTRNLSASQQKMQGILYIMTDGAQGSIESVLSPYMKIYADVAVDSPYFEAVDYVVEHQLMDAQDDENFGAAEAATLGEMAEGLFRMQGLSGTREEAAANLLETEKAYLAAMTPAEENAVDGTAEETPAAEEAAVEETVVEAPAAEETVAEEAAAEAPTAEAPAEEAVAEEAAAEAPTAEAPAAETPAEEAPAAADETVAEEAAAEAPTAETPAAEAPAEEAAAEEAAAVAETAAEATTAEEAAAEAPAAEAPTAEEAVAEEATVEAPAEAAEAVAEEAPVEDSSTVLTRERILALCKAFCGDQEMPEILFPETEATEATRGDLAILLKTLDQAK
ncbi:MAG: hypothetical protein IKE24_06570 [Clostridia bacterium]|nr:hypothetical protein [Clostridia bacterium]